MTMIEVQEKIRQQRTLVGSIGNDIKEIANAYFTDIEVIKTLERQLDHIDDKFLFVIVGEVNSGKSSFVNALLGVELCATSHDICTQEVQRIEYGASEEIIRHGDQPLITRTFPATVLQDITIVDTPGTNSRELDHQLITEDFLPLCNLVVFVFQVDAIHVESAWELFRTIKDTWRKKVIFVLTKSDRYTAQELSNYQTTLTKYAAQEGVSEPRIFVTSSKLESEGSYESGFHEVREFINTDILGSAAQSKILDDAKVLDKLLSDIDSEFDLREERLTQDISTRQRIDALISEKEGLAFANIQNLADRCIQAYDHETDITISSLREGIGFLKLTLKSIRSIFGGESTKHWLEKLNEDHVERLNSSINRILQDGVDAIKSDITYMVVGVKNELDMLKQSEIKSFEVFRELDQERTEILVDLRSNLTDFIEKSPIFRGEAILDKKGIDYSGVQLAGGIAAIGTTIAIISQASVVDLTGGVATALGLVVAGGIAATRKGKYLRSVREVLDDKKLEFKEDLQKNLGSYIQKIKDSIAGQFNSFDQHIEKEKLTISQFRAQSSSIHQRLEDLTE